MCDCSCTIVWLVEATRETPGFGDHYYVSCTSTPLCELDVGDLYLTGDIDHAAFMDAANYREHPSLGAARASARIAALRLGLTLYRKA